VEMDIVDKLQRIYYHARRVAKTALKIIEMNEARAAFGSDDSPASAPPEGR